MCPKRWKDCKICQKEYNGFLPHNEKIVDFIRWKELWWLIGSFIILILLFKVWGILIWAILDFLNHLCGGPVIDIFGEYLKPKEPKVKKVIFDCKICIYPHTIYIEDK